MNEYKCPKCNSTNLFTRKKDTQTGLYCKDCGRWIKWLNKEEARVFETDTNVGSKWIKVEDDSPKENGIYGVVVKNHKSCKCKRRTYARYKNGRWLDLYDDWENRCWDVTHWMPLPELPEEE